MYLTESSSPFVPGARPSNSSDARILMCASKPSGVIASSAGCNRNANSSTARSDVALKQRIAADHRAIFITYADVVAAFVSNAEHNTGALIGAWYKVQAPLQLSAFLRWPGGRLLFVLWADADFFQERLNRLFPAEEFLDGYVDVTQIAWLVNFAAQFHAGLFVEVAVLRFFEYGRHIGGDGVRPGISVVTGVVTIQVPEIRNERGARIDWQKNFFQDRIRHDHAIVRRIFGVLIVQGQIERRERELAAIKNTGVRQLSVVHFFDDLCRNFLGWIAVVGSKRIEHFLVPDPILQHLRGRLDKITGNMRSGETAVLGASDNRMQGVTEFVKQRFHIAVCQQGWFVLSRRREVA